MTFTNEWFQGNVAIFTRLLADRCDKQTRYVEIGAYEGQSLTWMMLNILTHPDSFAHVIDTFEGNPEHARDQVQGLEQRFEENTRLFAKKLHVMKRRSMDALPYLYTHGEQVDIVYVDGSHEAKDVLVDGVLSWELLRKGGILLFDDYAWEGWNNPVHEPKMAIDAFLSCYAGRYTLLEKSHVVAVKKEKD